MKKIVILCCIVALGLGVTGATCMQNVQTAACSPPAAVISILPSVIQIAAVALATFVPGTAQYLAAVNASAVANSIEVGICVSATQLNDLITFLQSNNVKTLQAKMMVKAGPMKAVAFNIQPLIDWQNSLK